MASGTMTAAVLYGKEDVKIEQVPIPKLGPGEVLVKVAVALTDVLGEAQTSYAGSIPERAWNVELATTRLNGPRPGRQLVWQSSDHVRARDGQIVSWHAHFDRLSVLEQLGQMPPRQQAVT